MYLFVESCFFLRLFQAHVLSMVFIPLHYTDGTDPDF